MIPRDTVLRVARPTDNLTVLSKMCVDGLGFQILSEFEDHNGFDGKVLGHPKHCYHLEFTHHRGMHVGRAPTMDNLLVFYVPNELEWNACCSELVSSGFKEVSSYNEYWDRDGKTFEDIDGYRVVIENGQWSK